jgi:predicted fused transcriptional regulator/phosphomethylpyrimidine kinase
VASSNLPAVHPWIDWNPSKHIARAALSISRCRVSYHASLAARVNDSIGERNKMSGIPAPDLFHEINVGRQLQAAQEFQPGAE